MFFFVKQKTAYEMRISDWSSDVCSSDLHVPTKAFDGRPENATRVSAAQRDGRLATEFWGSFVALTTTLAGSFRAERSPFGTINAYYAVEDGTLVIAYDASTLLTIANRRRSLDWDSVLITYILDKLRNL